MNNCQRMTETVSPPAHGRRERRKAETRTRLVEAARRLFVKRGYHATRPQDIAEAADVATGTFYVHFADKGEAFRAFSEQAAQELMARIQAVDARSEDFEGRLRSSLEALLAYSDENPGTLRAAFTDAAVIAADGSSPTGLQELLADSLAQGLRAGASSGRFHPVADYEVIAHGIVGFVSQALRAGSERGVPRERLLRDLAGFVTRAVVAATPSDPN